MIPRFRGQCQGGARGLGPKRGAGARPVRAAGSSCPTGGCGEPSRLPWVAAQSGVSAPAVARKWVGIGAEIIPKGASNAGQSLSQPCGCQLPLHKGALGTGDADCRVASLLAMTVLNLCHSEEAQRADVGIRPFYDGRGFGPPYLGHGLRRPNFVPKFGASVRSSAPTNGLPKSQHRADVGIGPYGKPDQPPRPAGAQRSVRARGREG